jgi:hypothetical protein
MLILEPEDKGAKPIGSCPIGGQLVHDLLKALGIGYRMDHGQVLEVTIDLPRAEGTGGALHTRPNAPPILNLRPGRSSAGWTSRERRFDNRRGHVYLPTASSGRRDARSRCYFVYNPGPNSPGQGVRDSARGFQNPGRRPGSSGGD